MSKFFHVPHNLSGVTQLSKSIPLDSYLCIWRKCGRHNGEKLVEERDKLGNLGIDWTNSTRLDIKIVLNAVWWKEVAGFIWLKYGQVVRRREYGHEPTVYTKWG